MQDEERRIELLRDLDRPDSWAVLVGGTAQSHVDLDDPRHLEFEYVRRLAHLVDLTSPDEPLRVLHLGGGGLTLPRYIAATRPGSQQHVVEVDAELVETVTRQLPLWPSWQLRVEVADARDALSRVAGGSADLVVTDVFAGPRIPAHLTSLEFLGEVSRVLAEGGTYAVNLADSTPLDFARAQVATVLAEFPYACMLVEAAVLRGRRFGNLVLLAGRHPLPVIELTRRCAADPFPATVLDGRALREFARSAAPVTDATAAPSPQPPAGSFGVGP